MVHKEWHEDDSFWETFQPVLFGEKVMSRSASEIDKITSLLDLNGSGQILDLCCGVGRHSLELARRGFSVTGVDRTEKYLDEARACAEDENLAVDFLNHDARTFAKPETYDIAMIMDRSFGYFDNAEDDRQVIENVHASLRPDGKFIIELTGKESFACFFQQRDWYEEDGAILLSERQAVDDWSAMNCRWILLRNGYRCEKNFQIRLYSAYELTELLKSSGFKNVRTYADLDGKTYHPTAKRLIAVATK
ncbi:Glycine/sarcosine N-methyltransferase [Anaerohalosphaera lusitana]|uniref:Glycine/sarcosine N-methyltransferase n=1 Tax=Anaerohalosphaera lusitana TaxID=1936003 RepID=A0A1U9NJ82_9BACT|nr:class I SAM-dependent methyltransferase [Anaerohalosphaera lusitana]AQT67993.1 Glycine/sarcosine N-methyltransferase [Anaerohalosphaera lusitana]